MNARALQLRPAAEVLPQPAGFRIVEEDDVAFSLSLCREVHGIYGQYQEGKITAAKPLEAGLMMTLEMLPALGQRVTTGMPSMRIAVAGAQIREMLAVLFDKDPLLHPISGTARDRYKSLVTHTPQAAAPRPVGPPVPPRPAKGGLLRRFRGRRYR